MQMCPDCGMIYDESEYAKCPFCNSDDSGMEDDYEEYDDPGWDFVYTEDGDTVSCPNCGAEELRYDGCCCHCLECDSEFSDQEIEDYAGPWTHS